VANTGGLITACGIILAAHLRHADIAVAGGFADGAAISIGVIMDTFVVGAAGTCAGDAGRALELVARPDYLRN